MVGIQTCIQESAFRPSENCKETTQLVFIMLEVAVASCASKCLPDTRKGPPVGGNQSQRDPPSDFPHKASQPAIYTSSSARRRLHIIRPGSFTVMIQEHLTGQQILGIAILLQTSELHFWTLVNDWSAEATRLLTIKRVQKEPRHIHRRHIGDFVNSA